jgi:hypothetical protein
MRCSYELYIYSNTDNIVLFTGSFRETGGPYTIENGAKRYYNPATKTKNK